MKTNIIYNQDCMKGLKEIPDKSIDAIITDPPYDFITKSHKGGGFIKKENKKHLENLNKSFGMTFDPTNFLKESKRILKKMNMYIFTNKTLLYSYLNFIKENNYFFDILIWIKPNPVPINNNHYLIDKEYCIYIREKGVTFNSTLGYKNYFIYFKKAIGKKEFEHPTVKPIEFIRKMIKVSTNKNDIILDAFMGTGTTAIACQQL